MDGGVWWAAVHGVADTTERLHFLFSLSCIGEGNSDPLQCSCLENPRERGAWWAAIYGVAQSRTRLKWLSSSSTMLFKKLVITWLLPLSCFQTEPSWHPSCTIRFWSNYLTLSASPFSYWEKGQFCKVVEELCKVSTTLHTITTVK